MLEFIREGGVPSLVILALGVLGLVIAARFAFRPDPRQVEVLRAFTLVLVFAGVMGSVAGVRAVLGNIPATPEWAENPKLHLIVMTGLSEALAPATLAFAVLTAMWLLISLGLRRLARQM